MTQRQRPAGGMLRHSGLTSIGAAAAIISGLVLDAVVAANLGAGRQSDAFFVAARIPLGITVMVFSSATTVLVPSFSMWLSQERHDPARLVSAVLGSVVVIGVGIVVVATAFATPLMRLTAAGLSDAQIELATSLTRVLFLLVPLVGAAEVLRAFLNARYTFMAPAAMNVMMNGTAAAIVFAWADGNPGVVANAYVAGATAQLVFIGRLAYVKGFRLRIRNLSARTELLAVGHRFSRPLLASAIQLGTRVGEQLIASFLPPGSITILNYGSRLISAIGGSVFFRSVVVAMLPRLTEAHAREDGKAFGAAARQGVVVLLALALPLTVFVAVLSRPAVLVVFQRGNFSRSDAMLLGLVLTVYSVSLIGAALQRGLLAPFFASLETGVYLRNTLYGALVNLAVLPVLLPVLGGGWAVVGVPIAYAVAQSVNVGHAWHRLRRSFRISFAGLGSLTWRIGIGSTVAAGLMLWSSAALDLSEPMPRMALLTRAAATGVLGLVALTLSVAFLAGADLRRAWRSIRLDGAVPSPGRGRSRG